MFSKLVNWPRTNMFDGIIIIFNFHYSLVFILVTLPPPKVTPSRHYPAICPSVLGNGSRVRSGGWVSWPCHGAAVGQSLCSILLIFSWKSGDWAQHQTLQSGNSLTSGAHVSEEFCCGHDSSLKERQHSPWTGHRLRRQTDSSWNQGSTM